MIYSLSENELDSQVLGEGFVAGVKELAAIRKYLGMKKSQAPDFPRDAAAAVEALRGLGQEPYLLETLDGEHVCVFERDGMPAVTVPQATPPLAALCALYFSIQKDQSVLT